MLNPTGSYPCGFAWRRHCLLIRKRCVGPARARRLGDQKRGAADPRRGGSMARSLGLGLGRSGCSRCGRRRFARRGRSLRPTTTATAHYSRGPYYPGPAPVYYGSAGVAVPPGRPRHPSLAESAPPTPRFRNSGSLEAFGTYAAARIYARSRTAMPAPIGRDF